MTFEEARNAYEERFKESYPLFVFRHYGEEEEKEIVKDIEKALKTGVPVEIEHNYKKGKIY